MTARIPAAGYEHVVDVYGCVLHLCTRKRQLERLAEDMPGVAELDSAALAVTTSIGEHRDHGGELHHVVMFIDIRALDGLPGERANTIAHEAAHAAGFILAHVGASRELSSPTDAAEHVAYLIGWIAQWVWEHLD